MDFKIFTYLITKIRFYPLICTSEEKETYYKIMIVGRLVSFFEKIVPLFN